MRYEVTISEGDYDFFGEDTLFLHTLLVLDNEDRIIAKLYHLSEDIDFDESDTPEEIADALDKHLESVVYLSDEPEYRRMIALLRENAKTLYIGTLKYRIRVLDAKKQELMKELEKVQ